VTRARTRSILQCLAGVFDRGQSGFARDRWLTGYAGSASVELVHGAGQEAFRLRPTTSCDSVAAEAIAGSETDQGTIARLRIETISQATLRGGGVAARREGRELGAAAVADVATAVQGTGVQLLEFIGAADSALLLASVGAVVSSFEATRGG